MVYMGLTLRRFSFLIYSSIHRIYAKGMYKSYGVCVYKRSYSTYFWTINSSLS